MPAPVDRLARHAADALSAADTATRLARQADELLNGGRTVDGLRQRAEDARRKAAKSRTRFGRAYWSWRARRLDEKADRLARSRP